MTDQQIATAAMLAIGIATAAVGLLRALEWVNGWVVGGR
jgi:hypothetical protein